MIEDLIKLANMLDENGEHIEANKIDLLIQEMKKQAEADPMKEWAVNVSSQLQELPPKTLKDRMVALDGAIEAFQQAMPSISKMDEMGSLVGGYAELGLGPQLKDLLTMLKLEKSFAREALAKHQEPELKEWNKEISEEASKLSEKPAETQVVPPHKEMRMRGSFETLSDLADKLDTAGMTKEADLIDNLLHKVAEDVMKWKEEDKKSEQSKRYDAEYHHSLQIREPKKEQERSDREGRKQHHVNTYQQTNTTALSTRYCPEHLGYSLGRVGENTYQCSLDGKVYNWETGWTDYQGTKHPGGSVAGQTPDSSGYAIPHRIFDSRENTLNRVN